MKDQENKLQRLNQGLTATTNILPQRVLNEQPDKIAVQKEIIALLERIVILYQIPNWSEKNGIILSEWIIDNYKFETMETIKACLKNPPATKDNNWRLTPDTINAWFAVELEKQAEQREKAHQKQKESELRLSLTQSIDKEFNLTDEQKANIDKYANAFLEQLKKVEIKSVRPMSEEEIKKEGNPDYDAYIEWKKQNGYAK